MGGAPYRSVAIGLRAVPRTNQRGPRQLNPTGEDPPEAHAWQRALLHTYVTRAGEGETPPLYQERVWQAASFGFSGYFFFFTFHWLLLISMPRNSFKIFFSGLI